MSLSQNLSIVEILIISILNDKQYLQCYSTGLLAWRKLTVISNLVKFIPLVSHLDYLPALKQNLA